MRRRTAPDQRARRRGELALALARAELDQWLAQQHRTMAVELRRLGASAPQSRAENVHPQSKYENGKLGGR